MKIDTTSKKLFGTTRSIKAGAEGEKVHVFVVNMSESKLFSVHTYKQLDFGAGSANYVTGIGNALEGGTVVHLMYFSPSSGMLPTPAVLYYMKFDTSDSVSA